MRRRLRKKQDNQCYYCGRQMNGRPGDHRNPAGATLDHLTPLSRGGTDDETNLVASCWRCNQQKGDQIWPTEMTA
jgi:5-methylcytosine-specific restriction endonuclease McrA